eukprot:NODE_2132_length_1284_cov_92.839676_g1940_i0.p1 GENE.NODE_2132_length_1284_cov_92.839676_g1940_i0~~NODE_2132_length_1284_cov_92.839676_g1940_i0.p1  ORF type:complete len:397 (+),score=50.48 NODE_2132_length_1284_cov_92.839676_g1940_i0:68-1192(+)
MSEQSKKPADTPFKQQRLPAWQPILSPPWVICCFFVVAVVFIPVGALVIVASNKVVEYEIRYDSPDVECQLAGTDVEPWRSCTRWVDVQITEKMEAPVYMYYKLENFYQNHRRYAKSRSDAQLAGDEVSTGQLEDCKPLRYAGELVDQGDSGSIASYYAPCGLIAWSMFNDSIDVYLSQNSPSVNCSQQASNCLHICHGYLQALETEQDKDSKECTKKGIAWSSDVDKKFKAPASAYRSSSEGQPSYYFGEDGHVIPLQTDEDFMVWMRTASLPTFRKLYRRFESRSFEVGDHLWFKVTDRFKVDAFSGKKYIVLSTTTWIGGKNYFLGAAYVAVGCICFLLACVFAIKHLLCGRTQGEIPQFPGSSLDNRKPH